LPMSDFGLIQITRQRIRPSVLNQLSVDNPLARGAGKVLSTSTLISNLETWISTFKQRSSYKAVNIYLNPYLKAYLNQGIFSRQFKWSWKYKLNINFTDDEKLSLDEFRITLHNSDVDITIPVMDNVNIDDLIKKANETEEAVVINKETDIEVFEKPKRSNHPQDRNAKDGGYKKNYDRSDNQNDSRSNTNQPMYNNKDSNRGSRNDNNTQRDANSRSKYYKND